LRELEEVRGEKREENEEEWEDGVGGERKVRRAEGIIGYER